MTVLEEMEIEQAKRAILAKVEAVNILSLKPGDVLVVKFAAKLPAIYRDVTTKWLSGVFPENKCIVLDGGAEIEIVRGESE